MGRFSGTCRHCNDRKVARPRGLCWTCYYTPGVIDQYPITSKFATHKDKFGEPTQEEVDRCIEEQSATLPEWWPSERPDDETEQ